MQDIPWAAGLGFGGGALQTRLPWPPAGCRVLLLLLPALPPCVGTGFESWRSPLPPNISQYLKDLPGVGGPTSSFSEAHGWWKHIKPAAFAYALEAAPSIFNGRRSFVDNTGSSRMQIQ